MRPDGGHIPILCAGASITTDPLEGVTWVLDISAQKRSEAEREALLHVADRARAEAEAASRAKDQFLAMLGHELRNPLSAVRNAVIAARGNDAMRDRALAIAERQTDQLTRLIDDLLDVARITHGRITLRRERVALTPIVERAIETVGGAIADRRHRLSLALSPAPIEIDADAARIEQVIVNLLANAAKYTDPDGAITVTTAREGGQACIRIADTGIGMSPELLPRVFDLFAQADRSLDRAGGGLGIGLTLVKRIVDYHGGSVDASSGGLGHGSEFVVRLPALRPAHEQPARLAPSPPAPRPASIIVVEDNRDASESLVMLLELVGHRVQAFSDGAIALDAARTQPPDMMLVDIGLPGIDGYEVVRRARQEPSLRRVCMIALTGYGRDEDRQSALAAGFDHHLVKPVEAETLHGLVARLAAASGTSQADA
jgi:signal transduction histidine kinase/CheY-like chemotaxis protein